MTIKIEKEVDIRTLSVKAGVRYWEDTTINGVEDLDGELIPCREGDYWCPEIDIDNGFIKNWTKGVKADIHYKVCDDGEYTLKDQDGNTVAVDDDYVPRIMAPKEDGFGDYIIMDVDENGNISDWEPSQIKDFFIND